MLQHRGEGRVCQAEAAAEDRTAHLTREVQHLQDELFDQVERQARLFERVRRRRVKGERVGSGRELGEHQRDSFAPAGAFRFKWSAYRHALMASRVRPSAWYSRQRFCQRPGGARLQAHGHLELFTRLGPVADRVQDRTERVVRCRRVRCAEHGLVRVGEGPIRLAPIAPQTRQGIEHRWIVAIDRQAARQVVVGRVHDSKAAVDARHLHVVRGRRRQPQLPHRVAQRRVDVLEARRRARDTRRHVRNRGVLERRWCAIVARGGFRPGTAEVHGRDALLHELLGQRGGPGGTASGDHHRQRQAPAQREHGSASQLPPPMRSARRLKYTTSRTPPTPIIAICHTSTSSSSHQRVYRPNQHGNATIPPPQTNSLRIRTIEGPSTTT